MRSRDETGNRARRSWASAPALRLASGLSVRWQLCLVIGDGMRKLSGEFRPLRTSEAISMAMSREQATHRGAAAVLPRTTRLYGRTR